LLFALVLASTGSAKAAFVQTDLVSDVAGMAQETDANLKNPWGMSDSPTSPMWVANQGTRTSTLYNALSSPIKQGLTVNVAGGPTGTVFNSTTSDFQIPAPGGASVKATFLFGTLAGTIQGWNPGSNGGLTNSEIATTVPGAVFTGLALGNSSGTNYLYAANTKGGILVFDSNFTNVTFTTFAGKFIDPNPVAGFTPFNIQSLNGHLFVTYAATTATGIPLPGGYVDEFDFAGNFIARIATNGVLDAPWGLAIAPASFGTFGGDLLVGNLFNSTINNQIDGLFGQIVEAMADGPRRVGDLLAAANLNAFNLSSANQLAGSIAVP
jgi:uncharacterized protein (TIGR03118 family)